MAKTKQSPGSLLLGYLDKFNLNCNRLSREIKCSQTALRLISLDKSRITTSIAVRLAKFFGTKPELWLLTQLDFDLAKAAANKTLIKQLKSISQAKPGSVAVKKGAKPKAAKRGPAKRGRAKK